MVYSKVDHPAVLKLQGYSKYNFLNKAKPVLTLEYMINGSLDKLLHNNIVKINRAVKYIILLGTALGMNYLHKLGIVHRDLKPANILLDNNLYPRICDFGCSFISDEELSKIQMNEYLGTAIYMAPEIIKMRYSYKVDVYSFSLLIYEILTEITPFSNYKTKHSLMKAKNNGIIPDCTMIKDEVIVSFLKRCWSLNPEERPTFADISNFILSERFQLAMRVRGEALISYIDWYEENYLDTIFSENYNMGFKFNILGFKYYDGIGVEKNLIEAAKYFLISSAYGRVSSIFQFARMRQKGRGISINKIEAAMFYESGALMGDVGCMFNLAYMYKDGEGIKKILKKLCFFQKMQQT